MRAHFFHYTAEPERIQKDPYLEGIVTLDDDITVKGDMDSMDPELILRTKANVMGATYVSLDWGENSSGTNISYFVTGMRFLTGGRISLQLHEDVLRTFETEIMASIGFVESDSSDADDESKMTHTFLPMRADKETVGVDFPNTIFSKGNAADEKNVFVLLAR